MHANQMGRMIEEYTEFAASIESVAAYLDANTDGNNWSNTLVIITADHDHLVYGPQSDTVPYQPLQDNGPGQVPGHKWHSGSHSNHLVPIYSRGQGAYLVDAYATSFDAYADGLYSFGYGYYLHQIDLGSMMLDLVESDPCYADSDRDGEMTIDDFITFQSLFAVQNAYADCDGDGRLSVDDFVCFQTMFAGGCR
jgi:alkaline phosphatase